jgi:uncharacterized protein YjbI with pentapeptide repeats
VSDESVSDEPELSWWERRALWLRIPIISGAVLVYILIWWLLPPLLYAATSDEAVRIKAITDTRTALLAGLVGIGALGTFYVNARTQRFTAETLRISEANFELAERSQKESIRLAERGHLTDRYTKAIEQLGSDKLDVRLGGIYALEQLATDSDNPRDQATIVEVVSAFVRVHSNPLNQYRRSFPGSSAAESPEEERRKATEFVDRFPRPPVDVRVGMTVLGRLPSRPGVGRGDLTRAHLKGVDLAGANLAGATFSGANLTDANLQGANLSTARLDGAILTHARLYKAILAGAYLADVHMDHALCLETDLTKAKLPMARLTSANLAGAKLHGANLSGAKLLHADLTGLDLSGQADPHPLGLNLSLAVIARSELGIIQGADVSAADLFMADLSGAVLARVYMTWDPKTDIRGELDLSTRGLTQTQVDAARGNSQTTLPGAAASRIVGTCGIAGAGLKKPSSNPDIRPGVWLDRHWCWPVW